MRSKFAATLFLGLAAAANASAAAPSGAPAGSTGACNDGSYSSSPDKKGACRGHKGVKEWYEQATTAGTTTSTMTPPAAPATTTTTKATATTVGGRLAPPPIAAAPGGGNGNVWINTSTKVYHCSGDKYYGTTKHGEYVSEADAKAKGYHADHGRVCGQ